LDPTSSKKSAYRDATKNYHRQMFQPNWPTDAPVPTAAPVETDPLQNNCGLLVECVNRMSLYDLFVLYHSDDIDPDDGTVDIKEDDPDDPNDDPFVTFRTFDEDDIVAKFRKVKGMAEDMSESPSLMTIAQCSLLLKEFHRIIEFDEVNNWEGSSVSQVCLAEGTPVFVKLSEIAKLEDDEDMATSNLRELLEAFLPFFDDLIRQYFEIRTLGQTIAISVFRDFFACTKKLTPVNAENPFQSPQSPDKVRIPIGYDTSKTDEHGKPQADTCPFLYEELVSFYCVVANFVYTCH
jgi:hypothetical protein